MLIWQRVSDASGQQEAYKDAPHSSSMDNHAEKNAMHPEKSK